MLQTGRVWMCSAGTALLILLGPVLAIAAMAMASESDLGSGLCLTIQKKFKQIGGGAKHKGPQGMELSEYINWASADCRLTDANWYLMDQRMSTFAKGTIKVRDHP